MEPSLSGVCQDCMKEAETNLYHGNFTLNRTDGTEYKGVGSKLELCGACYQKMVIFEQIEYWKIHMTEERSRSSRQIHVNADAN